MTAPSTPTRGHTYFDHKADVGIIGFGPLKEDAFAEAAVAMFDLIVDVSRVEAREKVPIECQGADREELFVEWLNTLLAEADIRGMVFSHFHIRKMSDQMLKGQAGGERLDQHKHQPKLEVKAATYCMLSVMRDADRWVAQCVVDV